MLPRINEDVNEEWLADKGRFSVDGLKRRRLDSCWVRRDGTLQRASWPRPSRLLRRGCRVSMAVASARSQEGPDASKSGANPSQRPCRHLAPLHPYTSFRSETRTVLQE